jgi:hypothetical protein
MCRGTKISTLYIPLAVLTLLTPVREERNCSHVTLIEFVVYWFVAPCSVMVGYQCFGGFKMEAARPSETLVSNRHPEKHDSFIHRRETSNLAYRNDVYSNAETRYI